ncbi:hypothetical protein, partial [Clostridium perfringens]
PSVGEVAGTALPHVAIPLTDIHAGCVPLRATSVPERPMTRMSSLFVALFLAFGWSGAPARAQDKALTAFAAASMKNALDELNAAYTA